MGWISIEIKARVADPVRLRKILLAQGARFKGLDHQIDTYFRVRAGPSKLPLSKSKTKFGRSQYQSIEAKLRLGPSKLPLSKSKTKFGRLKLREGNIENALIYYKRTDQKSSKQCDSTLYECRDATRLKQIFKAALGVFVVVDKKREIYFMRNAKFHLDRVKRLGNFVEIEVFDRKGNIPAAKLRKQCEHYQKLLGIRKQDLLADSYSDQLLRLEAVS